MTFEQSYDYIGSIRPLLGPRDLPILKPPFTSLLAIDMNSGEHRWRLPLGRGPTDNAVVKSLNVDERLGNPYTRGWALVTKTLLFAVQSGTFKIRPGYDPFRRIYDIAERDTNLWVYDKTSGEMLAEIPVGNNASGAPITYLVGGKQYIVFSVGGGGNVPEELVAVGLP
jgi:quinoprotein glucose dehydrogenase